MCHDLSCGHRDAHQPNLSCQAYSIRHYCEARCTQVSVMDAMTHAYAREIAGAVALFLILAALAVLVFSQGSIP